MNNKLSFLLVFVFMILSETSFTQNNFFTEGNQSPIIKGTKAYLEYNNQIESKLDVPDELAPMLAGLLLANDKSLNEAQPALEVWIRKYNELHQEIMRIRDGSKKNKALVALKNSDFGQVERILNIRTDYQDLVNTFSNTYQTSGNQSPIIIGDQASIKYVVNQVIKYKLPEGVTVNMLKELKLTRGKNVRLSVDNKSKEQVILDWINRYTVLENRLENTPGELTQQAYFWFKKGYLDKALEVLEQVEGSSEKLGMASFLQAEILELRGDLNNGDINSDKIFKCYQRAAALTEKLEVDLRYAMITSGETGDFDHALRILKGAKGFIKNDKELLAFKSVESYLYERLENYELAEKLTREALAVCNKASEESDTLILKDMLVLQVQLANILDTNGDAINPYFFEQSSALAQPEMDRYPEALEYYQEAQKYDSLALETLEVLIDKSTNSRERFYNELILCKNNYVWRYSATHTPEQNEEMYEQTYLEIKTIYEKNNSLTVNRFVEFLKRYHTFLIENFDYFTASEISEEALVVARKSLNTGTQATYLTYDAAARIQCVSLSFNGEYEYLYELVNESDSILKTFYELDNERFASYLYSNQEYLASIAYRIGRHDEAIKLCENLIIVYGEGRFPTQKTIRAAVNKMSNLARIGFSSYHESGQYKKGLNYLDEIDEIFDGFKKLGNQFYPMINSHKLLLEIKRIDLRNEMNADLSYKKELQKIIENCFNTLDIDPENAVMPYVAATQLMSNINTKNNNYAKDKVYAESAFSVLYNYIPMKYLWENKVLFMTINNDVLKHYLSRGKFEEAKQLVEIIEGDFKITDTEYSLDQIYQVNNIDALFGFQIELSRGYRYLAEYYGKIINEGGTEVSKRMRRNACRPIRFARSKLSIDWQTNNVIQLRKDLKQLKKECGCR